jgi:hypothetical protein
MKYSGLFVMALAVALSLGASPAFGQHGGGHGPGAGIGPGAGPGMDQGRGRGPNSPSKIGDNGQTPRETSKSPEQLLAQNTKLSESLAKLLPPGTNLENAAQGFKNLGQFVAAVHVSHNLDIPFSDLKSKMISGDSLGQAIRDLKPGVNAKDEAKKANRQAKETVRDASS